MPRFKDLVGERFGRLLVMQETKSVKKLRTWLCLCDCGDYTTRISANLKMRQHCGCQTLINLKEAKRKTSKDLTGIKFGRLTALCIVEDERKGAVYWKCLCSCGNYKVVRGSSLTVKRRPVTSCGCSRQVHGLRQTKENEAWRQMKARCLNPKRHGYINYGGRGIKICDQWLEKFEHFYEDMGVAPTKDHTLERVDVNGNYCPENCIWLHRSLQNRNVRHNALTESQVRLIRTLLALGSSNQNIYDIFRLKKSARRTAIYPVIKGLNWKDLPAYSNSDVEYKEAKQLLSDVQLI